MNHIRNMLIFVSVMFYSSIALSQVINIPNTLWSKLSSDEKHLVSEKLNVNIVQSSSFGKIIDTQTLNESTPGTNIGSQLGSALASASYIDNAFSGNTIDYSAKSHLGMSVLGAVVGSTLDKRPVSKFLTRYTIKLNNGNIKYVDDAREKGFRHSIGVCVYLSPFRLSPQELCETNKYKIIELAKGKISSILPNREGHQQIEISDKIVLCKIGNNPQTSMPLSICNSIGGKPEM